jgi:hypothetical protein
MTRPLLLGGAALAGLALCLSPSSARARGVIVITHGDTVSHLGDVAPEHRGQGLPATAVGFKYSSFGVFWLDLWTWGGQYCLYQGHTYWELSPAQAAQLLNKSEADLGKPFLYRFPPGLLILILGVAYLLFLSVIHKSPEQKAAALLKEERYRKALEIFFEQVNKAAEAPPAAPTEGITSASAQDQARATEEQESARLAAAFEAAVQHLTEQGVARAKAEQNLAALLSRITAAPPGSEVADADGVRASGA